jgi:hypothetical protein
LQSINYSTESIADCYISFASADTSIAGGGVDQNVDVRVAAAEIWQARVQPAEYK